MINFFVTNPVFLAGFHSKIINLSEALIVHEFSKTNQNYQKLNFLHNLQIYNN